VLVSSVGGFMVRGVEEEVDSLSLSLVCKFIRIWIWMFCVLLSVTHTRVDVKEGYLRAVVKNLGHLYVCTRT